MNVIVKCYHFACMDQKKAWSQIKIIWTTELCRIAMHSQGTPYPSLKLTSHEREGDFGCCWRSKFGINRRIHFCEQEYHGLTGVWKRTNIQIGRDSSLTPSDFWSSGLLVGTDTCLYGFLRPNNAGLGVCGIAGMGVRRRSFRCYFVCVSVSSWATYIK